MPPGLEISLQFQDGRLSGQSGCNHYQAAVEEPRRGQLRVDPAMAVTQMACPDQKMAWEDRYLKRLRQVDRYDWHGDSLLLHWQERDQEGRLLFRRDHP